MTVKLQRKGGPFHGRTRHDHEPEDHRGWWKHSVAEVFLSETKGNPQMWIEAFSSSCHGIERRHSRNCVLFRRVLADKHEIKIQTKALGLGLTFCLLNGGMIDSTSHRIYGHPLYLVLGVVLSIVL
jgi:hypothetical protein